MTKKKSKTKVPNILPVKLDDMAHDLINADNMDIIEWIVMTIYDKTYDEVHGMCSMQNIRLTRTNPTDKNKYVDFLIKFKDNYLLLELNNHFSGSIVRNTVFGMAKIVAFYQTESGDDIVLDELNIREITNTDRDLSYYKKVIKLTVVNLNWYSKNIKLPYHKKKSHKLYAYDDEEKGIFFEVINIALDKYANLSYNKIKKCDIFYKLLTVDSVKKLRQIAKGEPLLKQYVNKLINLSNQEKYKEGIMDWSIETDKKIERDVAYTEGYNGGVLFGKAQGIEQNQRDIILNMFEKKYALSDISDILKLSIDKVQEIIDSSYTQVAKTR